MLKSVQGLLGEPFGPWSDRFHGGLDFEAAIGTTVRAAPGASPPQAGTVAGTAGLIVIDRLGGVSS